MKNLVFLLGTVFCLSSCVHAHGQYEGHELWRFNPKNERQLRFLADLEKGNYEYDFWKDPIALGRSVDLHVSPSQKLTLQQKLETIGLEYSVNIKNIQDVIDNEKLSQEGATRATSLDDFDYSIYHDADEIYEWLDWIAEKYAYIEKVQVGTTFEGRPIYSLEIKKTSANLKPVMYLDALIHCREWISAATAIYTLNEMLTNPTYQYMIDEVDWYYIPMINVDGYIETYTGDRLWRKTRSTGASSVCPGVDANRNWDDHWSGEGASGNPCSATFYGPAAASESETRHLQNYIQGKGDIDAVITVHSYSQLILYPYNYAEILPPNNDELNMTSKGQHDAVFAVHGKNYIYGPGATTIYICSGVTTDWTYNVAGIALSYTYELRDEGEFGFVLPADQIIPNGEEFIEGIKSLTDYVITNKP